MTLQHQLFNIPVPSNTQNITSNQTHNSSSSSNITNHTPFTLSSKQPLNIQHSPTHLINSILHLLILEVSMMKQNSNVYLNIYNSKIIRFLVSQKPKSKNPQKNISPTMILLSTGVQLTLVKLE